MAIKLLDGGYTFFAASGSLAFDGLGWPHEQFKLARGAMRPELFAIVVKTLTYHPLKGNLRWFRWGRALANCVHVLDTHGNALTKWQALCHPEKIAGTVNAVGLTNRGYEAWCADWRQRISHLPYRYVVSIAPHSVEEAEEMTQAVVDAAAATCSNMRPGMIVGIEVVLSCPNLKESSELMANTALTLDVANTVCQHAAALPVLLKLGITQDYMNLADKLRGKITAYSFNAIPWSLVFPNMKSPLEFLGVGGGVSGKLAQKQLWAMMLDLAQAGHPVIGPSVWDYDDIWNLLDVGAEAVHFGALHLRGWNGPRLPTDYVLRWMREHPDDFR